MRVANAGKLLLVRLISLRLILDNSLRKRQWLSLLGGLLCSVNCHSTKIWSRLGEILEKDSGLS